MLVFKLIIYNKLAYHKICYEQYGKISGAKKKNEKRKSSGIVLFKAQFYVFLGFSRDLYSHSSTCSNQFDRTTPRGHRRTLLHLRPWTPWHFGGLCLFLDLLTRSVGCSWCLSLPTCLQLKLTHLTVTNSLLSPSISTFGCFWIHSHYHCFLPPSNFVFDHLFRLIFFQLWTTGIKRRRIATST